MMIFTLKSLICDGHDQDGPAARSVQLKNKVRLEDADLQDGSMQPPHVWQRGMGPRREDLSKNQRSERQMP